jgi:hypothetical protein
MTSFFPDLNVWLALSLEGHPHETVAWEWLASVPLERRIVFCRYTQMGFLRLLTTAAVMGRHVQSLGRAWVAYDQWLEDFRVEYQSEPVGLEPAFRAATSPLAPAPASKWVGDCYLAAFARESGAALVTFDKALAGLARKLGCRVVQPGRPATAR